MRKLLWLFKAVIAGVAWGLMLAYCWVHDLIYPPYRGGPPH